MIKLLTKADDKQVLGESTSLLTLEYRKVPRVPKPKGWTTRLTSTGVSQHRTQAICIRDGGTQVGNAVVVVIGVFTVVVIDGADAVGGGGVCVAAGIGVTVAGTAVINSWPLFTL